MGYENIDTVLQLFFYTQFQCAKKTLVPSCELLGEDSVFEKASCCQRYCNCFRKNVFSQIMRLFKIDEKQYESDLIFCDKTSGEMIINSKNRVRMKSQEFPKDLSQSNTITIIGIIPLYLFLQTICYYSTKSNFNILCIEYLIDVILAEKTVCINDRNNCNNIFVSVMFEYINLTNLKYEINVEDVLSVLDEKETEYESIFTMKDTAHKLLEKCSCF